MLNKKSSYHNLKLICIFTLLSSVVFACKNREQAAGSDQEIISNLEQIKADSASLTVLTSRQTKAFDALDELQIRSADHLYSTYAGIHHPCFPADTSFVISSTELAAGIFHLMDSNEINEWKIDRDSLILVAVQAQEKYQVLHCFDSSSDEVYRGLLKSKPREKKGIWVLPNILGHRDLVLAW